MTRRKMARKLTFEGAIELFRAQEQLEQVTCLLDNPRLQEVVAAWEAARVTRAGGPFSADPSEPHCDLWDRLWAACEVDEEDLATKTAQSLAQLRRRLAVARGNRLIYPDGTTNGHAKGFFRAQIARQLGVKPPRATEAGR